MIDLLSSKNILFTLLWFGIGCLYAVFTFKFLVGSFRNFGTENNSRLTVKIIVGTILRFLVMGLLLFISVRLKMVYGFFLVMGYSLSRLILIKDYAKKADQQQRKSGVD